jgi:glutathionyl-hydroquinone reductase
VVLPSLRSITSVSSVSEPDDLARRVEGIELDRRRREISADDRHKHVELIRSLLLSINSDYKRRFGTPQVKDEEEDFSKNLVSNESRDIEMAA